MDSEGKAVPAKFGGPTESHDSHLTGLGLERSQTTVQYFDRYALLAVTNTKAYEIQQLSSESRRLR